LPATGEKQSPDSNVRNGCHATAEMTMLKWSSEQRALLAETLRDVANIAVGAMVFGQFLGAQAFSPWLALLGVVVWSCLVVFALVVAGRNRS